METELEQCVQLVRIMREDLKQLEHQYRRYLKQITHDNRKTPVTELPTERLMVLSMAASLLLLDARELLNPSGSGTRWTRCDDICVELVRD